MALVEFGPPVPVTYDDLVEAPRRRHNVHCSCGRFAHYVTSYSTFLGDYTEWRMVVLCTRCGEVEIY